MINLLDLDAAGLAAFFADLGEKPFRAKQVSHWVHQRLVGEVEAMTDLSRALREKLSAVAMIHGPAVVSDTTAADTVILSAIWPTSSRASTRVTLLMVTPTPVRVRARKPAAVKVSV